MKRRSFLAQSTLASFSPFLSPAIQTRGANDRIVMGVIGIHDRGMDLAEYFGIRSDVEIRYLADPDSRLFAERADRVERWNGKAPTCVRDYRKILEDSEVDAVAIAAPDHWHALITIEACQAGKHVYVEKPVAHNIWEGRQMVQAARKYNRHVQVGTQNRSAEYLQAALETARSNEFGDIHFIRVLNNKKREVMPSHSNEPVPEGVDYDLWLGPAPEREFNQNHFHYNWHWSWTYSGGDLINDGIHQIDLARWVAGQDFPTTISSSGGIFALEDGRETPDTQTVNWEFPGLLIAFEQTLWTPYMSKIPWELRDQGRDPNWPFNGTRVEVYGSKRFMMIGRMGDGWQVYDEEGNPFDLHPGQYADTNLRHASNFLDGIRGEAVLTADIEEGHRSTLLAHAGNISYRTGRKLVFDVANESFLGCPEANVLLKREYRAPYVVPEQV